MFKRMKLTQKLSLTIGTVLTLIFVILIIITVILSKSAIESSTFSELTAISKLNGVKIQEIVDIAESTATDIQKYIENAYKKAEEDPKQMVLSTEKAAIDMLMSVIYDNTLLAPLNYDVEQFLSETARNTAVNSEDIIGVGIMFEQNAFQDNLKSYSFYVDEKNATGKIEPFGDYETYSKEDYYKRALQAKVSVVTEPYEYNGVMIVTYASPVVYNNEVQAVVLVDVKVDNFSKVEAKSEYYPSMYAAIYDQSGNIIYDSQDTGTVGKNISEFTPNKSELDDLSSKMQQNEEFVIETTRENGHKVTRFLTPITAANETWWSLTAVETSDVNEAVNNTMFWLIVLSVTALIIIIATIAILLRSMLAPLKGVVAAAESIAQGHLDVNVDVKSEDEIGVLSKTFQNMSSTLKVIVNDARYLLVEMAEGNFNISSKVEDSYVGDFETLIQSMRKLNYTLSDTLGQINESADQVSSGSDQVSSGAQELSQGATQQASAVEELAATISEISNQVKVTADNATQAREETNIAREEVTGCNSQMQDMIMSMEEISSKSNEIGKIIKKMEDIAFQTNILALNASVEAARAGGAAGKGFAVVAEEVRNLSIKSSEASKDTANLIKDSIKAVERGTEIANETAKSLVKVVEDTQSVSVVVNKIATAANEQASAITQVTQGIDQISSVVQTNSATAEESAAASEELSSQSTLLKDLVSKFKLRNTDQSKNFEVNIVSDDISDSNVKTQSDHQFGDKY